MNTTKIRDAYCSESPEEQARLMAFLNSGIQPPIYVALEEDGGTLGGLHSKLDDIKASIDASRK